MKFRVGTYNVNNLFERSAVMQLEGFSVDAAEILGDVARLNELLEENSYKDAVGQEIVSLLEKYQLHKDLPTRWFSIVEVRKKLFSRKQDGSGVNLVAKGRNSWLGWVELTRETVQETSTENTARVIREVQADILCLVEVESRPTLQRFNEVLLEAFKARFKYNLLVDGNDQRGIDVGILSNYPIRSVRSHIHDTYKAANGRVYEIFSRDCAEYEVLLPQDKVCWVLCNHFKSKGYGSQRSSDAKRARQAKRVKQILSRFDLAQELVVVAGDLNDTPDSPPLQHLLQTNDLIDALGSPKLQGPRWTYQDGANQIDYLLVSKALFQKLAAVGIERRGIYSRDDFDGQFPHFPEVDGKVSQASDHAAVWAEFDV
ncbi:MAG: endonuclease/exonuclease/phosphatase family protein [Acidobacteriota bacterium]